MWYIQRSMELKEYQRAPIYIDPAYSELQQE